MSLARALNPQSAARMKLCVESLYVVFARDGKTIPVLQNIDLQDRKSVV